MKNYKLPFSIRLLIATGLFMTTLPLIFREYIPLPDFFRGFLAGLGLTLEVIGFIMMKRLQKGSGTSCY